MLLLAWPAFLFARLLRATGRLSSRLTPYEPPRVVRIDGYSFAVNSLVTLGEAEQRFVCEGAPDMVLSPERLIANAPCPGFLILEDVSVGGVPILAGRATDAFVFSPLVLSKEHGKMPPIGPRSRVVIKGYMTGLVPPGFRPGTPYLLAFSFQGPAVPEKAAA